MMHVVDNELLTTGEVCILMELWEMGLIDYPIITDTYLV